MQENFLYLAVFFSLLNKDPGSHHFPFPHNLCLCQTEAKHKRLTELLEACTFDNPGLAGKALYIIVVGMIMAN